MMEPTSLLEHLFDKKKMAIIRAFISQPEREFTLLEMARASRVSNATTYRILRKLQALGLINEKKIKHLRTYSLSKNDLTKYLSNILVPTQSALDKFIELISEVEGVKEVILHGRATKDKANVLIIGNSVNSDRVNSIVSNILEKYHFQIIHLVLDPIQYQQMVSMGLYSGLKKELYKKT